MRIDDAIEALVGLAASRHNAFHSAEAAEILIPVQRLRRAELKGELKRLHPRVWAFRALPDSPKQILRAATLSIAGAAATTTSAAWLHGWIDTPPTPPQMWVPSMNGRNHPVADLRRCTRIDPRHDLTEIDHITTLNKAATLCLLGPHVSDEVLERCLDDYLRTESERWLDETAERLRGHKPGGVRALERIRNDPRRAVGVTDSWMERVVAKLVALPWMPPIELQHPVAVDGRHFRLDIACPELMLGVEAHGRSFHWGVGKEDADNVRDLLIGSVGWKLLYVTFSQLQQPDEFVRLFEATARARAAQLDVHLPAA